MKAKLWRSATSVPTIGNYVGAMPYLVTYKMTMTLPTVSSTSTPLPSLRPNQAPQTTRACSHSIWLRVDPEATHFHVQSDVPAHTQAAWMILCTTGLGSGA